jgi:sterol desaturase/sphingolipid hydroxylase (fatty acid hydroxylase superfamily)
MIIFPPVVLVAVAFGFGLFGALLLWWIWSLNAALIFYATVLVYYACMQVIHVACHLDVQHPFINVPGMRYLWQHHRIHHIETHMRYKNFNFIVPFTDFIMKTNTQK